jgi:hypothetical protein
MTSKPDLYTEVKRKLHNMSEYERSMMTFYLLGYHHYDEEFLTLVKNYIDNKGEK